MHSTWAPCRSAFLLCLPTYDERENLAGDGRGAGAVRERTPVDGDVLVIDDSSPDGTGELADALAAEHPWLHVLHRPLKEGLGRAYLAGFRWALERDYDYVLEMDCDFSHDPEPLPSLLDAATPAPTSCSARATCAGGGVETGASAAG